MFTTDLVVMQGMEVQIGCFLITIDLGLGFGFCFEFDFCEFLGFFNLYASGL